jgi:hypothetical protein
LANADFVRASSKPLPKFKPVQWRNRRPKHVVYIHCTDECLQAWGLEAARSISCPEIVLEQDDRIVLFRKAPPEDRFTRRLLGIDAHGRALSFADLHSGGAHG